MKLILKEDVNTLGKRGEVVKVAEGYARNFLIPKNLAVEATPKGLKSVAESLKRREAQHKKDQANAEGLAATLAALEIKLKAKVGENDKLFGSITSSDIADALKTAGHEIDKRKINLEHPLKELGVYTVPVKLHTDVEAKLKVWIEKE